MERTTHWIVVAWREGEAEVRVVDADRFASKRRFFIDQGFMNLQAEWYEAGAAELPDLVRVFAYWEDPEPDLSPSYEQLRAWGRDALGGG